LLLSCNRSPPGKAQTSSGQTVWTGMLHQLTHWPLTRRSIPPDTFVMGLLILLCCSKDQEHRMYIGFVSTEIYCCCTFPQDTEVELNSFQGKNVQVSMVLD
jgi:hypothetical protein